MSETDLYHQLKQTSREMERLRAENERLRTLLALAQRTQATVAPTNPDLSSGARRPCLERGEGAVEAWLW